MRLAAASWCNVKLYHLPRFSFPHSSLIVLIVATRGGLRWRDTDLSFLLSLSLSLSPSARVSFLLTYGRINAPSRSYLRRIVVGFGWKGRNSDEELSTEISEIFSFFFLFPREKFILYGIEHESDITVSFFSIASKSRYVREGYIIRDDYKFFLLLHVTRCKCVAFF